MLLHRVWDPKLAQAGYLLGCTEAGEALVIDATRDADQYLALAASLRLRIAHVTETHIHADFASGSRELAARAGAKLYLSDAGGDEWRYAFAASDRATLLHDGDRFTVGRISIEVLHTPGHTPEHLTFLVTDGAAATEPIAAVTGDFVFVGDVGRPDLLERAAGVGGTMEAGARTLFRSIQRFKAQPDYLQIWPGHGAGSACGKGLSAIPHSQGRKRLGSRSVSSDRYACNTASCTISLVHWESFVRPSISRISIGRWPSISVPNACRSPVRAHLTSCSSDCCAIVPPSELSYQIVAQRG